MNKRIKELVKQAEQYAIDKANEGTDEDFDYSFDDDFQEKFAKLIVRECADLFDKDEMELSLTEHRVHSMIKEHFGVEE